MMGKLIWIFQIYTWSVVGITTAVVLLMNNVFFDGYTTTSGERTFFIVLVSIILGLLITLGLDNTFRDRITSMVLKEAGIEIPTSESEPKTWPTI